ncbi:MAG: hypothetical protein SFU98_11635 [Leptospiraceae bacterium]|nr:hypothetical protein [Leptospiraceae bacterium]
MKEILNQFYSVLSDSMQLLNENEFPIHKLETETSPENISYNWKEIEVEKPTKVKHKFTISGEKNFSCKICKSKLMGIKGFQHKGTKPILVLHYTGEFKPNGTPFIKTKKEQIFRTNVSEDLFDRMIKKVFGFGMRDLYFQEFPGCNFNPDTSSLEDWKLRQTNCEIHVQELVQEEKIKGIILTGSAATLYLGKDKASASLGKISDSLLTAMKIPSIVLRSSDGILSLEEKRKRLEKDKNSKEFLEARKEENEVKALVVKQLTEFKEFLKF